MRAILSAIGLASALLAAGHVQAANSWGLPNEEISRFEAKVVDVLCELSGNCPTDGGAAGRQLGLLLDDGTLVLPVKNATPFSGTQVELLPFFGKRVIADGLFTTNHGYRVFALQFIREAPDGEWRGANRFIRAWARNNGFPADAKEVSQWFRHDPGVKALIAKQGKLGLGPEADKAFLNQ